MRIDKYLSDLKIERRSRVKNYLKSHEVWIDGERIKTIDFNFDPKISELIIDHELIPYIEDMHIVLYKPEGYLSAHKDLMHQTIFSLLDQTLHRFDFKIAGRLDLDAEGLLILTTDGKFVHEITHPKKHLDKVYEVILDQAFMDQEAMMKGIFVKDEFNEPYEAKAKNIEVNEHHVTLTIDMGKFHQVKRMFEALGYHVIKLKRIKIGHLTLRDLKPGEYYQFGKEEL
ncbi:MAG: pseudouridine synthase [Acholeplasmataceae bacterium]|jgi:16S rRNA pseudouridine516 synthase|nr:pseudouridine synthase [Acholeplasmataceae bacterium]MDY0338588.1 pseudouridine synthase [Acholeplasmataceae bacterium]